LKNFSSYILIFSVFEKKVRHRIHHIFDIEAENKILKFWKYRLLVSAISPWMADVLVSASKKPYQSISSLHPDVKC